MTGNDGNGVLQSDCWTFKHLPLVPSTNESIYRVPLGARKRPTGFYDSPLVKGHPEASRAE